MKGSSGEPAALGGNLATVFVDNLHPHMNFKVLRRFFENFGSILDAYVPRFLKRGRKCKFGFIRVGSLQEAEKLVERCNGIDLWEWKLYAKLASFGPDKRSRAKSDLYVSTSLGREEKVGEKRSFKDVLQSNLPNTKVSSASSTLHYVVDEEEKAWLDRSIVGFVHHAECLNSLQEALFLEGFRSVAVRPMGGKMVLITCEDEEDRLLFLNEGKTYLDRWFHSIKPWESGDLSRSRFIWLRCEGVPLHAWNYNFFKKVGNLWGNFISLDECTAKKTRLDVGRILIVTDSPASITQSFNVDIEGVLFEIKVVEEFAGDFMASFGTRKLSKPIEVGVTPVSADVNCGIDHSSSPAACRGSPVFEVVEVSTPCQTVTLNSNIQIKGVLDSTHEGGLGTQGTATSLEGAAFQVGGNVTEELPVGADDVVEGDVPGLGPPLEISNDVAIDLSLEHGSLIVDLGPISVCQLNDGVGCCSVLTDATRASAEATWAFGKSIGMSFDGDDASAVDLLVGIKKRHALEFESSKGRK